ncbi:MAG TPA: VanZ family protein [Burkholderiales bacterium]|nr:VanZ family protein [Burkholderiales bacterium]
MRKAGIAAGWGWAAAIVWLSLTPAPPEVDIAHSDKLGHFAGYGLLMFWFAQLYQQRKSRIAYALGFVAMGVGLEFLQGQLGYRTYEVFDMYANTLGVLLGWTAAIVLPRIMTS